MNAFLDWVNTEEIPSLIVLICLLHFIGGQMARAEAYRRARQVFPAAFLLYVATGMHTWGVENVTDFLVIVVKAILAATTVFGVATILFPIAAFLYQEFNPMPKVAIPEPEIVVREIEVPQEETFVEPPPLPTQDEKADEARRRYEAKVQMLDRMEGLDDVELRSAKEKAKKQYLKDIDELLK